MQHTEAYLHRPASCTTISTTLKRARVERDDWFLSTQYGGKMTGGP
jgi:hypothetical protein